jgi:FkbM family methyltransferase
MRRALARRLPGHAARRRQLAVFYRNFLARGDLCFDVGANLGDRTEAFLATGANLVAIEPQAACFAELQRTYGNNSRVWLIDAALGDTEGIAEISICDKAPTISTMSERWRTTGRFANDYKWSTRQPVRVTTLDTLIDRCGLRASARLTWKASSWTSFVD